MTDEKIVNLSYYLRRNGMDVSIRSTIMASHIWNTFQDEFNQVELKEGLKSVYVKSPDDLSKFERAYNYVFIYNKEVEIHRPPDQHHINVTERGTIRADKNKSNPTQDKTREAIIRRRLQQKEVVDKTILSEDVKTLDTIDYRVFDICKKFSKKIVNRRNNRKKKEKSRNISIPKTIRKNLKNGGHLITLVPQKPRLHKSKHIFLCDISGSCEWATTWFFSILYGCHESFDKITVYDYDNRIIDVTKALYKEYKNSFQINVAHQSLGLRPRGHTDMTKSFSQFLRQVELDKHTDVIILTDCRDWTGQRVNGILESAKILHKIVLKSRSVIIFNPESKIRWNTPTSCVQDFEEAGAKIYETNTIEKFANVINNL